MSRWSGEMEFEFVEGQQGFVTTEKSLTFIRSLLARGDVQGAARLYEDGGTAFTAELLREAQSSSSTSQKALGEMFVVARDFKSAAQVFEIARAPERAAQLYEQANDPLNAARVYEKIGDLPRAAACLERGGDVARAVELYKKAGPSQGLAEALARMGHFYDAAGVYKALFNLKGEVEMLRQVPLASEVRVPAALRLAELLEQYHHPDQAAGVLLEAMRGNQFASASQPMYMALAGVLERMGRLAEAAQVRARIQNQLPPAQAATTPAALGAAPVVMGTAPHAAQPVAIPEVMGSAVAPPQPLAQPPQPLAQQQQQQRVPRDPFAGFVDPFGAGGGPTQPTIDAYSHLKGLPIFAELSAEDMRELYRACDDLSFTAEQVIVEQGMPGRGLFVIVNGNVRVVRQDAGKTTELARLTSGAQVGELSLLDDAATSARVIADGPVTALFISRDRFAQFLSTHERAAMLIFRLFARVLAGRLRDANLRR